MRSSPLAQTNDDPTPCVEHHAHRIGSALVEIAVWVIELLVGLACLVLGMSALRTVRYRLIGIVLFLAGAAAAGHALIQLSN